MKTIDDIKSHYQGMHDKLALGGLAKPIDDGNGYLGFFNCETYNWDWWKIDETKGEYVNTGSTQFIGTTLI